MSDHESNCATQQDSTSECDCYLKTILKLEARVEELEEKLRDATMKEQFDDVAFKRKGDRIKELEESMPAPGFLSFVSQVALCRDVLNSSDAKRLKDMADHIETVMNRR